MKIKGITHIHSRFSDGILSLQGLRKKAKRLGFSFALISEHLEKLKDFNKLKEECSELSSQDFLLVPGIEAVSQEGYHLLAYNINELPSIGGQENIPFLDLCDIFCSARTLLVLAHASLYVKAPPQEFLERLDGIEVWNTKYDSRHAPNLKTLELALQNKLIPLAGVDAHGPFCLKKLWLELEVSQLQKEELFKTLKQSRFKISNHSFSVDLREDLDGSQILPFRLTNAVYRPIRWPFAFCVRRKINLPIINKVMAKIFSKQQQL